MSKFLKNKENLKIKEDHDTILVSIKKEEVKDEYFEHYNQDHDQESSVHVEIQKRLVQYQESKPDPVYQLKNFVEYKPDLHSLRNDPKFNKKEQFTKNIKKELNEDIFEEEQYLPLEDTNTNVQHKVECLVENTNLLYTIKYEDNIHPSTSSNSSRRKKTVVSDKEECIISEVKDKQEVKQPMHKPNKSVNDLNNSQKLLNSNHSYSCGIFPVSLNLKTHVKNECNEIKNECQDCHKVFSSAQNLKLHTDSVHKGMKSYQCNKCHKMFSRPMTVRRHIIDVHNKIKRECNECHTLFSSLQSLKKHMKSVHEGMKSYECDKCHKMFSRLGDVTAHIKEVHTKINKKECNQCHKLFSSRHYLKVHINSVHKGIKGYQCSECNKILSHPGAVSRHKNQVHIKIKKECDECHKMFSSLESLKIHINSTHRGIKAYQCSECHKMFSYPASVSKHKNQVHRKINESVMRVTKFSKYI